MSTNQEAIIASVSDIYFTSVLTSMGRSNAPDFVARALNQSKTVKAQSSINKIIIVGMNNIFIARAVNRFIGLNYLVSRDCMPGSLVVTARGLSRAVHYVCDKMYYDCGMTFAGKCYICGYF